MHSSFRQDRSDPDYGPVQMNGGLAAIPPIMMVIGTAASSFAYCSIWHLQALTWSCVRLFTTWSDP
jgi:hypothetical protein